MSPRTWDPKLLEAMREVADPVADPLIMEVYRDGGMEAIQELRRFLEHWAAPVTKEVPAGVAEFLEAPVVYPDWVDQEQLLRAQKDFPGWAVETLLVLFLKSFAQFFADGNAAIVFYRAHVFDPDTIGRFLIEIAQLVFDVMRPGELAVEPEKALGVTAVQKLRLHHSIIRLSMHQAGGDGEPWDPAWGKPINQEDLACALMAFAVWDLDGLRKLGLELTPQQQEETVMLWKVVGFLLGLDERLQPADLADGRELLAAIGRRQFGTSEAGVALVRELLRVVEGFLPSCCQSLPTAFMRFLMTPRFIVWLEVPRARLSPCLVGGDHPLAEWILSGANKALLKGLRTVEGRPATRGEFRVAPEIEERYR